MKRRHNMHFGAECREDGSVRFRLWAPALHQVEISFAGVKGSKPIPLKRREHGWFELTTDAAGPGTLYYFRIDGEKEVPDPASRFQPRDVHGPSEVIDPNVFNWKDEAWRGRDWNEAVLYEVHVGAFSETGTFSAVRERLDYLAGLGITAIELMPVSDFPGRRNWGYDGVFPFAPDSTYGRPEDLKELVQAAHERGIMVLLDVVYNHFGPEGDYLGSYAPQFFTERHKTPWGNGINFDGDENRVVRDFFIHNALYWLTEYNLDGLRLDAVHAIVDDSTPDILTELATTVRSTVGPARKVHLIVENERNQAGYLRRTAQCQPRTYDAQWNDDIHHALHVLITGEKDGYYSDYATRPVEQLGRCLVGGFAYQGEVSLYSNGETRGESTEGLPPTAFVSFLQNHDQIGNRAFGERIVTLADPCAVRAAAAILLLAPAPPMLFMGEEFGAQSPFLFFCDFEKDLAAAVTAGRRNEFARFARFNDPGARKGIPDPNAEQTFESSRLDWNVVEQPAHQHWLAFYRRLIRLRHQHVVPRLSSACKIRSGYSLHEDRGLTVHWEFSDCSKLTLLVNLGAAPQSAVTPPNSPMIYASENVHQNQLEMRTMPPWSVVWFMEP
ncbi:MAG TPA: malto-oligosyltrehalose trehalohydrolase [Candidatus Polarisedimenticolia bacterium]|nr:malto-oligosyltrehalose trehalohydrolase [Candidatus Polarisedimenticolia bacterium]